MGRLGTAEAPKLAAAARLRWSEQGKRKGGCGSEPLISTPKGRDSPYVGKSSLGTLGKGFMGSILR